MYRYILLNKLYTLSQVIRLIRSWQSALSLYWNLLRKVIHTEIVLLTKREVFWAVKPTPSCTFTGYKSVFILEWIENNEVVRLKQD